MKNELTAEQKRNIDLYYQSMIVDILNEVFLNEAPEVVSDEDTDKLLDHYNLLLLDYLKELANKAWNPFWIPIE